MTHGYMMGLGATATPQNWGTVYPDVPLQLLPGPVDPRRVQAAADAILNRRAHLLRFFTSVLSRLPQSTQMILSTVLTDIDYVQRQMRDAIALGNTTVSTETITRLNTAARDLYTLEVEIEVERARHPTTNTAVQRAGVVPSYILYGVPALLGGLLLFFILRRK